MTSGRKITKQFICAKEKEEVRVQWIVSEQNTGHSIA